MHEGVEQHWELKKAGKSFYDFDDHYRAAQQSGNPPDGRAEQIRAPRPASNAAQRTRPPPDPEVLRQALDKERPEKTASRNARPRFPQVCLRCQVGWHG
jgi:hypothetical protein